MIPQTKSIASTSTVTRHHRLHMMGNRAPHLFEVVFFEDGKEKMVLAQGSAAFMQWVKNELKQAPPYNHGLLLVRHKEVFHSDKMKKQRFITILPARNRQHTARGRILLRTF